MCFLLMLTKPFNLKENFFVINIITPIWLAFGALLEWYIVPDMLVLYIYTRMDGYTMIEYICLQ